MFVKVDSAAMPPDRTGRNNNSARPEQGVNGVARVLLPYTDLRRDIAAAAQDRRRHRGDGITPLRHGEGDVVSPGWGRLKAGLVKGGVSRYFDNTDFEIFRCEETVGGVRFYDDTRYDRKLKVVATVDRMVTISTLPARSAAGMAAFARISCIP